MYGIAVSSGPAVMQFFILLAKTAFGKKDPSRYCGTVPLQVPLGWGGDKAPPAPPPAWSLFALTQVNIFKTSCFAVNDYTISDS